MKETRVLLPFSQAVICGSMITLINGRASHSICEQDVLELAKVIQEQKEKAKKHGNKDSSN